MNSEFPVFVKCGKDILSTFVQNSINALNRRDNSEKSVLEKKTLVFSQNILFFFKKNKVFF